MTEPTEPEEENEMKEKPKKKFEKYLDLNYVPTFYKLFSKYFIGFGEFVPFIIIGSLPEFDLIVAPNFFKGFITLLKSLFERLLSPFKTILFFECIKKPNKSLPSVPELPAYKEIGFL